MSTNYRTQRRDDDERPSEDDKATQVLGRRGVDEADQKQMTPQRDKKTPRRRASRAPEHTA